MTATPYIPVNATTTAVLINSHERKRAKSHTLDLFWIAPLLALGQVDGVRSEHSGFLEWRRS